MNILFLTISRFNNINERGIYTDLTRKFIEEGNHVYVVAPLERRYEQSTTFEKGEGVSILRVKTLNMQKTNSIEKGIGMVLMEYQYILAINKYLSDIHFDLIIYSTPPITFTSVISKIKKRDGAMSYLLLKDIFPQNAVDLGMIKKNSILHKFFSRKEKRLYSLSDKIGCMTPANVDYVLRHNKIDPSLVEVCPNSIKPECIEADDEMKHAIRDKYGIPRHSTIFVYGGNLGKPQGLDSLLDILADNNNKDDRFILIVGSGTEFSKIEKWFNLHKPNNALLLSSLAKVDYDKLVKACDVGLIFLDGRFTIPNYPSRLLSYLENKMPILAATDMCTDIGKIAEENGYGKWCRNGDTKEFNRLLDFYAENHCEIEKMGQIGYDFLLQNYTVDKSYDIIMNSYKLFITK